MAATVTDYAWWSTWRSGLAEAHCVTLLGNVTTGDVVGLLCAEVVNSVSGIDALYNLTVQDQAAGYDPFQTLVGVTQIDSTWSLIAEINGFVGVTESLIGPMSCGRTIVSHFRNINAVHRFHWWRDGRLLVDFDLLFPADRFGTDPAALGDDILREVGLPLDGDSDEIAQTDFSAAGFALAERITGVQCTRELFERSDFVVARVAIPSSYEQQ